MAGFFAIYKASQLLEDWQIKRAARIEIIRKKRRQWWKRLFRNVKLAAAGVAVTAAVATFASYKLRSSTAVVSKPSAGETRVTVAY